MLLLSTSTGPEQAPTATCVSPLTLQISLPGGSALDVAIKPMLAPYASGSLDPTNSPLWSCFAVVFSPFMTWTVAQQVVDTGSLVQVPNIDNYEYEGVPTTSIPLAPTPRTS